MNLEQLFDSDIQANQKGIYQPFLLNNQYRPYSGLFKTFNRTAPQDGLRRTAAKRGTNSAAEERIRTIEYTEKHLLEK